MQANREQTDERLYDAELVRRTLAGDTTGFDELIHRFQRRAVSVAYRLLGNSHDAMEVCQEAFLRAFRALDTLQDPERFGPWLMRTVSNLSLNFRRSRRQSNPIPVDDCLLPGSEEGRGSDWMVSAGMPPDDALASELGEAIQKALGELPEKQRLALVLFSIEGMPQKEVAEVLDCSVEAVKWHVFKARKTLKEKLGDYL
ncbi:MAG: RNA polymerase sigma factor [Phycisphaerae bacterium]|nr:RNA polymerase sigma factor [Phycisphaerae bacterium]